MTTTVIVSTPYNSIHDVVLYVERQRSGVWTQESSETLPAGKSSEPIVIDSDARIIVVESGRAGPKGE